MYLSCYVGLMYSSCSCSKYRHWLPTPMDCMVWDDHPVRLYSQTEYGIDDSHPFYLRFTSLLRRRWSPSSSRFKFQQAESEGRYDFYLHCTSLLCLILELLLFFTSDGFVHRRSEVLCVYQPLFISSAFFVFLSGWIQNICFHCVVAAGTTTVSLLEQQALQHSTKDYHEIYSA